MNLLTLQRRTRPVIAAAIASALLAGGALAQAPLTPAAADAPIPAVQDIRDIRGPKRLSSAWLIPALAATIAVGVGSGYAAWMWRRRRQRRVKLPRQIALDRLEAARSLMRDGNSGEFSIAVSSIVREYVENAFHMIATHLTTHEFLSDLLHSPNVVLVEKRVLLADFLESCDLAKFGCWNLTLAAMTDMHASARRFIVESAAATPEAAISTSISTATSAATSAALESPPLRTRDIYDSLPTT